MQRSLEADGIEDAHTLGRAEAAALLRRLAWEKLRRARAWGHYFGEQARHRQLEAESRYLNELAAWRPESPLERADEMAAALEGLRHAINPPLIEAPPIEAYASDEEEWLARSIPPPD